MHPNDTKTCANCGDRIKGSNSPRCVRCLENVTPDNKYPLWSPEQIKQEKE